MACHHLLGLGSSPLAFEVGVGAEFEALGRAREPGRVSFKLVSEISDDVGLPGGLSAIVSVVVFRRVGLVVGALQVQDQSGSHDTVDPRGESVEQREHAGCRMPDLHDAEVGVDSLQILLIEHCLSGTIGTRIRIYLQAGSVCPKVLAQRYSEVRGRDRSQCRISHWSSSQQT